LESGHQPIFSAAGAVGTLAASVFHIGTSAADADDRIIYDQAAASFITTPTASASAHPCNSRR
jgi:hypothetical protein